MYSGFAGSSVRVDLACRVWELFFSLAGVGFGVFWGLAGDGASCGLGFGVRGKSNLGLVSDLLLGCGLVFLGLDFLVPGLGSGR